MSDPEALEKYKGAINCIACIYRGASAHLPDEGTTTMTIKLRRSIRKKLTGIIMLTCATSVLLACAGFVLQDVIDERDDLNDDLTALGAMIASNSDAALAFRDHKEAQEVLSALRTRTSVFAACLYDDRGLPFVTYFNGPPVALPARLPAIADGLHEEYGRVELFRAITLNGKRVGHLYVASDLRELHARMKEDARFVSVVLLVCLIVAFVLSSKWQRGISEPIVELACVAAQVSREKDFSVRVSHRSLSDGNEIDDLMAGFNGMLAELEQRDRKLVLHQTELETTVAQRTAELTAANDELLIAKNAAEKAAAVNAQLARQSALILNSATDGIFGIDLDSEPSFLNPAGAGMLGRSLADLRGGSIHTLIHHSDRAGNPIPEKDCPLGPALLRGEPLAVSDDTFWRPDGTSFPVEYSATPMFDEDGNKAGAVLIFRDITERRAIEKLKSEFVSTVSHELRTPLTSIRGALGLLSSGLLGSVAEKGQRMLEIAVANTDRLVRLINDILDLERIESGKVELTHGVVDAQAVVDQAREGLQSMADAEGIRIVVEPFAATLWGDSDRVIQMLTNLIGNAIKFSPANTTVTLSGTAGVSEFTFCVSDEGRGVPDDKLASIFQRFNQVDASDSRAKGGSGLGLAICQSIVTAHGGRIWAEKNQQAGTRVQFTIPLARVSAIAAMNSFPQGAIAERGDPSVLVVEDDLDLARVMTTSLQGLGLRTFHTASGCEAVRMCEQEAPSLIVLDLGLPDVDGFAVVKSLRQRPALRDAPLLVYSALDLSSADQSRLRLGTTEFLTKSRCSLTEFENQVIALLGTVPARNGSQNAA
jgi:PAS domain S-box-containing protein